MVAKKLDGMSRVCMYLRKSRKDEKRERDFLKAREASGLRSDVEFDTLDRHRKLLRKEADRLGLKVAHVYAEVVSGELLSERPQAQEMLAAIWRGEWDAVMVVELARLGRGKHADQGRIVEAFRCSTNHGGTAIVTPGKIYDPYCDVDVESIETALFDSARELRRINRRLYNGMLVNVGEGQYIAGCAPFGYDKITVGGMKTLKPNGSAPTVVLIFELIADGMGCAGTASYLNARGLLTQNGKEWSSAAVSHIVDCDTYLGYVCWGKYRVVQTVAADGISIVKKRTRVDDYVKEIGLHEPIVSDELAERARKAIADATPLKHDHTLKNPLSGILVCPGCGKSMSLHDSPGSAVRYRHARGGRANGCINCSVEAAKATSAVVDALKGIARSKERAARCGGSSPSAAAREELEKVRASFDRIYDLFDDGKIEEWEFLRRREVLLGRKNEAERVLGEDSKSAEELSRIAARARRAAEILEDGALAAEHKNRMLKKLVSKVRVRSDDPAFTRNPDFRVDVELLAS